VSEQNEQEYGPTPQSGASMAPPPPPRSVITELPSRWPKAIGIINIIFGSIGFVFGLLGVLYMIFMAKILQMTMQSQPELLAQMEEIDFSIMMGAQALASGVVGILWSIVLFSSGVMLLRRSRNARFTTMLWAVIRIFLAAAAVYLTLVNTPRWTEHLQELADQGNEMAASMTGRSNLVVGISMALLFGLPYPLFILIWFMRSKIKAECVEW
jgi:hypothetical protein